MSEDSAVILIASWHTNDLNALKKQLYTVGSYVPVTFVIVGESESVEDDSNEFLKWDLETIVEYLTKHNATSLPWCVISAEEISSSFDPILPSIDEQDYFAAAIEAYNNFELYTALKWFDKLLIKEPTHQQGLFNLASILHMIGLPILSIAYIEELLKLNPEDVTAHSFLWALTADPHCTFLCTQAYRRLSFSGDLRAITKLATLTGEGDAASRGNPSYARQIYDDMADKFENKLVDCLGYKGPWQLLEMLDSVIKDEKKEIKLPAVKGDWRILDVGCGSGLVGRIFVDYVVNKHVSEEQVVSSLSEALRSSGAFMIGIDISQRMVEITIKKGGYDYAEAGDVTETLRLINNTLKSESSVRPLDMVMAADTFIYVGALGEIFAEARQVLTTNGVLIFSTEDLDTSPMRTIDIIDPNKVNSSSASDYEVKNNEIVGAIPGWGGQLLKSARFAHSHSYIEALSKVHGFKIIAHQVVVLRTEETIPLTGNLYILQKLE